MDIGFVLKSKQSKREENSELKCLLGDYRSSLCDKLKSHRWKLGYICSVMTLMLFCLKNCMAMTLVCISANDGDTKFNQSLIWNMTDTSTDNNTQQEVFTTEENSQLIEQILAMIR